MKRFLQRVRGTMGIGLTWAFGWAVGGIMIGVMSKVLPFLPIWDPFFEVFDAPLPALAVPGFFAGIFFASVVGTLGRRQRLNELSVRRFVAWGATAGVLLTAFPFALVAVGLASTSGSSISPLKALSVITGPFILFSAGSAALTLILARRAARNSPVEASESDDTLASADAPLLSQPRSLVGWNTVTGDPSAIKADAGDSLSTRDISRP